MPGHGTAWHRAMVELRQELLGKGGMDPHFREPNLTLLQDTIGWIGWIGWSENGQHTQKFNPLTCSTKTAIKFSIVFLITFFLAHIFHKLHVAFVVTTCHNTLAAVAGRFESSNHQSEPWRGTSEASFACRGGAKRIQKDHLRIW